MTEHCYPVVIQEDEDGLYFVSCPAIEGCYSQGSTVPEALANIREAIELCLEVMRDRGETPPPRGMTLLSEVVVAA